MKCPRCKGAATWTRRGYACFTCKVVIIDDTALRRARINNDLEVEDEQDESLMSDDYID